MSRIIDRADLFYRQDGSDKVYHLQLVKQTDLPNTMHRVDFQYGRRGSTLNTGTKIAGVTLKDARKVYDRVYGEKFGKGYRPIPEGNSEYVNSDVPSSDANNLGHFFNQPTTAAPSKPSQSGTLKPIEPMHRKILWAGNTEAAKATTPAPAAEPVPATPLIVPQLCNPIATDCDVLLPPPPEIEVLLRNDAWGAQEKKDGKHFILNTHSGVQATNKKGGRCGFPLSFSNSTSSIPDSLFDGEGIGDKFHVFDLLELEGEDLRGLGYGERFKRLSKLENRLGDGNNAVRVVPLAIGYKAKKALYDRMVAEKKEGVVFKRLDAPFKAGRPSSGGDMLKFKFYAEASVRVRAGRAGKRSVGLEILDGDVWMDVGNVTIPPNKEIPNVGDVVEIKYLYVQGVGGHLYQPIYKEVRDDIDEKECTVKQLKYKAEED
jgi:hypothetical protein